MTLYPQIWPTDVDSNFFKDQLQNSIKSGAGRVSYSRMLAFPYSDIAQETASVPAPWSPKVKSDIRKVASWAQFIDSTA
jgi:hypothetical protein